MDITLDTAYLKGFVDKKDFDALMPEVERAHEALENRTGAGSEFTGWIDLPDKIEDAFLDELTDYGEEVRKYSDCLISIGIGGSYVGLHAALEFLIGEQKLPVYYAGNNLSSGNLYHMLKELEHKRVTVVVISKSGTTTEPALAFRIIYRFMEGKYKPAELKKRIIVITDPKEGTLRKIALKEGYRIFSINPDVGGRFSVLTPAGLVPLAIAGIDIKKIIEGARKAQYDCSKLDLKKNIAYQYAAARQVLYKKGKDIEVLSTFYQRLNMVEEWWKQLHGESLGKEGKGLFPTSLSFTADLHSMGQLLQEGPRNILETFMTVEQPGHELIIPHFEANLDNFNCVAGKDLDYVNKQAFKATAAAHYEGGVPNMTVNIPRFDADCLGQLFYFFMKGVGIKGYLMGINPFDQPGVEAYKKKMFALLGRR
ncbi:MAG TPA: glucose-6-phosphate isomerase [Candidatus Omnitrophota bacterium]|nr:glucose-6-phosphate isomerase [Candidatus Omnitrophota bacterium]